MDSTGEPKFWVHVRLPSPLPFLTQDIDWSHSHERKNTSRLSVDLIQ